MTLTRIPVMRVETTAIPQPLPLTAEAACSAVEVRVEVGAIPIPRVVAAGEEATAAEAAIEPSHAVLLPARLAVIPSSSLEHFLPVGQIVHLRGHDEVVLMQAVDLVGLEYHAAIAPSQCDVGMMSFRFA
jgi:hypothetical protein